MMMPTACWPFSRVKMRVSWCESRHLGDLSERHQLPVKRADGYCGGLLHVIEVSQAADRVLRIALTRDAGGKVQVLLRDTLADIRQRQW